jgi:type II secretory pathway pseudopilin PulG
MVVGVTGIIMSGVTSTLLQVINTNIRNTNYMTAVRQVQSAGYWVTRDGEQALSENITAAGSSLAMVWPDTADLSVPHTCTYTLVNNSLWRTVDGVGSPIANQISSATFSTTGTGPTDVKLTFAVTSTVETRGIKGIETRVYDVAPRLRLSR